MSYCKICAYRVLILSEKDWGFDQDSSVCMCVCVCVVCVWWWWGGSEGGVLPEGFSPEQFALDLVRRKDDNRTLWVKGFFLIPSFILVVASQPFKILSASGQVCVQQAGPCHPTILDGALFYTDSNNLLPTCVQACTCEHCTCSLGKQTRVS